MRVQETDTKPFRAICESLRFEFKEIKHVAGAWGFAHIFISKQSQKTLHNFVRNFCPIVSYAAEVEDCILDVFSVIPLKGILKARKFFVYVDFVWHLFTIPLSASILKTVWALRGYVRAYASADMLQENSRSTFIYIERGCGLL